MTAQDEHHRCKRWQLLFVAGGGARMFFQAIVSETVFFECHSSRNRRCVMLFGLVARFDDICLDHIDVVNLANSKQKQRSFSFWRKQTARI